MNKTENIILGLGIAIIFLGAYSFFIGVFNFDEPRVFLQLNYNKIMTVIALFSFQFTLIDFAEKMAEYSRQFSLLVKIHDKNSKNEYSELYELLFDISELSIEPIVQAKELKVIEKMQVIAVIISVIALVVNIEYPEFFGVAFTMLAFGFMFMFYAIKSNFQNRVARSQEAALQIGQSLLLLKFMKKTEENNND